MLWPLFALLGWGSRVAFHTQGFRTLQKRAHDLVGSAQPCIPLSVITADRWPS